MLKCTHQPTTTTTPTILWVCSINSSKNSQLQHMYLMWCFLTYVFQHFYKTLGAFNYIIDLSNFVALAPNWSFDFNKVGAKLVTLVTNQSLVRRIETLSAVQLKAFIIIFDKSQKPEEWIILFLYTHMYFLSKPEFFSLVKMNDN